MSIYDLVVNYPSPVGMVQQYEVVFDGSTNYIDLGIVPVQSTILKVWGRFRSTTGTVFSGCEGAASDSRFFFGTSVSLYRLGTSLYQSGSSPDTLDHKFEINDGQFLIDDVVDIGTSGQSYGTLSRNLFVGALNGSSIVRFAPLTIQKIEFTHSGITYTINLNEGTGNTVQDNFGTSYTIQGDAVTWTAI